MRHLTPTLLVISLFFSTFLSAQTNQLHVAVSGHESYQSLPDVSVFLDKTKYGGVTNAQGGYTFTDIPEGSYSLVVKSIGFITQRRDITIAEGQNDALFISLEENITTLPEVAVSSSTLTGGLARATAIGGSATYLSPKVLAEQKQTDIGRILREVPGVSVQDEDGFGLRPNIGMRGTGSERSSKISLMEDGILLAPAPYAAPAAYFFPTAGRMQGIEVVKGSSQIEFGPYTTGGALNLISTAIPNEFSGLIDVQAGEYNTKQLHAYVGNSGENFDFLVESFQYGSDGFKELDGGGTTGFQKADYLAKLQYRFGENAWRNTLSFKIASSSEESEETYLGLTAQDFDATPYRRYAASQNDLMTTQQEQYSLRYSAEIGNRWQLTSVLYRNNFHRNWYKLDKVNGTSISSILSDPAANDSAYQVLTGRNSATDAVALKANNRSYYAQGWQTTASYQFYTEKASHLIKGGIRLHQDQIDRFQWVDGYQMTDGNLFQTSAGTPGTESNRIETANAVAAHLLYQIERGALTITPGLRNEQVRIKREDFGKEDPDRTGTNLSERENRVSAWIPGVSADYQFDENMNLFAGIHKGFAPPGSAEGTNPEESWNYETGIRGAMQSFQWTAVLFFNDYENLLGVDLSAGGGAGTGDLFNGGTAQSYGLELSAQYDLLNGSNSMWRLPVRFNYTFTQAQFTNSFDSDFEPWGSVESGDQLPYLAQHRFNYTVSVEYGKWDMHLSGQWQSESRAVAGQGAIPANELIPSFHVLDLSLEYHMNPFVEIYGTIRNVTNEVYLVSLRPAGGRPGLPQLAQIGLRASF